MTPIRTLIARLSARFARLPALVKRAPAWLPASALVLSCLLGRRGGAWALLAMGLVYALAGLVEALGALRRRAALLAQALWTVPLVGVPLALVLATTREAPRAERYFDGDAQDLGDDQPVLCTPGGCF